MKLIFKLADVLARAYPNIAVALRELEFHERQLCVSLAAREDQIRRQLVQLDVARDREQRVRKVLDDERNARREEQAMAAAELDALRAFKAAHEAPTKCGAMDDEVRAVRRVLPRHPLEHEGYRTHEAEDIEVIAARHREEFRHAISAAHKIMPRGTLKFEPESVCTDIPETAFATTAPSSVRFATRVSYHG